MADSNLRRMYIDWKTAKAKGLVCVRIAKAMIFVGKFLAALGMCPKPYIKATAFVTNKSTELAMVSSSKFDTLKAELGD